MAALKQIEVVGLPFSMVTVDSFLQDDVSDQKGFDSLLSVESDARGGAKAARPREVRPRDDLEIGSVKVTALPFSMVTVGSFRQKNVHGQKGFDRMLTGNPMADYLNAYAKLCSDVTKAYFGAWAGMATGFALPRRERGQ